MRNRSRSTLDFAREALAAARGAMPHFRSKFSKHLYSQHQLFAILALKTWLKLDDRGLEQLLREWSDLRRVLGLVGVPHSSTLCLAHRRLFKGGGSHA